MPPPLSRRAFLDRSTLTAAASLAGLGMLAGGSVSRAAQKEVLPKHITPETLKAVIKGLDYLALKQSDDGSWVMGGGEGYPVAMTALAGTAMLAHGNSPTRGKYAKNVQGAVEYLVRCATPNGPAHRPLAGLGPADARAWICAHVPGVRVRHDHQGIAAAEGAGRRAQGRHADEPGPEPARRLDVYSRRRRRRVGDGHAGAGPAGGAQRGVPGSQSRRSKRRCATSSAAARPEGGIQYSLLAGGGPRLPISAAAVATLYNAGQFDSTIATDCLKYVWDKFRATEGWDKGDGHSFYAHLYAAQGFYMAGDQYWDAYFPATRDQLLAMQEPEGSWNGDGVGDGVRDVDRDHHPSASVQVPSDLPAIGRGTPS